MRLWLEAEALAHAGLLEKQGTGGLANLVHDEAHAQHVPRAIQRAALKLFERRAAPIDTGPALRIPDNRPALAVIEVSDRETMPIGTGIGLTRPLFRFFRYGQYMGIRPLLFK